MHIAGIMSLLSWERGLKFFAVEHQVSMGIVAPFVGAWIEISSNLCTAVEAFRSLLSWERGLKFPYAPLHIFATLVAPFVGAWIEIAEYDASGQIVKVAPFVGAWIEIQSGKKEHKRRNSRSFRGSVD